MKTQTLNVKAFQPLTLGLVATSVLALAGLGMFSHPLLAIAADPAKPTVVAKPSLTVSLSQPKTAMVPITLYANGNVAAWQEASVGAEAAGLRVLELKAQVGDVVQRGQVLATFAAEGVQADVALARAGVAEAAANALDASANADRARAVQGTGALSAQQVSQYLTAEMTARARGESAKAQLDAQLLRLKHTRLLAPDSGTITARTATVGAVLGAGTELFRMIRQSRLEWRGEVTSTELGRITAGTRVVVNAPSGAQMQGRVRMVAPTVDAATRNGLVYVDLTGSAGPHFKPGMFARGAFELGSSSALTVPQTAVVVRDGFSYVYRVGADNRVAQLKVKTGRMLGDQIEIVSGVKPEDRLVTSGSGFLSDGDLVRVVDAAKPISAAAPVLPAQAAIK
jgi:HlyD family secretion protein